MAKEVETVGKENVFKKFDGKGQKEIAIAGERYEAKGNWSVCLCDCGKVFFSSRGGNVAGSWLL